MIGARHTLRKIENFHLDLAEPGTSLEFNSLQHTLDAEAPEGAGGASDCGAHLIQR
jgi:hypothetical protein